MCVGGFWKELPDPGVDEEEDDYDGKNNWQ